MRHIMAIDDIAPYYHGIKIDIYLEAKKNKGFVAIKTMNNTFELSP